MDEKYTTPAACGAALLDEARPGWSEEIATSVLDLSDCSYCVLGQLFGSFSDGVDQLLPGGTDRQQWEVDHGFERPGVLTDDWTDCDAEYDALVTAWMAEIVARSAA